jgi:hypothetical protein
LVADGAVSAEGAGARAGAAVGAGTDAAEAIGGSAAGRAAFATGVLFLATGFFGGFTACRVT